ncbi:MAG: hypothetical protein SynsKO_39410 [Synoicihabitans sp.]
MTALIGLQALVFYGLPIINQNEALAVFPANRLFEAGLELFLFGASMTAGWWIVFNQVRPSRPFGFRAFSFLEGGSGFNLATLGQVMLFLGVAFQIATTQRWLSFLPGGIFPVVRAVADALGLAGGLISAFMIARGAVKGFGIIRFWLLYAIYSLLIISNYTLFPASSMLIAVCFGLFLGRGKIPYVFLFIVIAILAVLNLAKFDMRRAYWERGQAYAEQRVSDLPDRYSEWISLGWERLLGNDEDSELEEAQRLSSRVDNLVILLRAQSFILDKDYAKLNGETYWLIPPLFIPRFLWPNKPRTHEGMVILNTHFGQQTREDSLVTYISWGLLPEAYANFGPFFGAISLGLALGIGLGWLEWWSRDFPLASFQSMVVLTFTVNCAASFESVASVWLTSVFQMIITMGIGLWAFTEFRRLPKPQVYQSRNG